MKRPIDSVIRKVNYMDDNLVAIGNRGRLRKIIYKIIKKILEVDGFTMIMIHDKPQ